MTRDEAVKLATAIAKANGHSHPEEWAEKVGDAFDSLDAPPADDAGEGAGEGESS